ncbi:probable phosphoserine aminotransferase [Frankliniella occidentalis]|uniref:Phosphoserine aminotransferase n=1 Tax=Frankliniella occidentalis TaxID=133901 RepID=A0A9C6X0L2_FRAOC|nr:probable phosphoserine aminotransferase [Frankliniella occidentalis]
MAEKKVINFGAGPAKLPEEVMLEVQKNLVHYGNSGISVMEMSHRSADYSNINDQAQQSIRDLLNVPQNYKIIFLQGGGTGLFAAVALNLMGRTGSADYLVTGSWSAKAAKEAAKYGKVNLVFPKVDKYTEIPPASTWKFSSDASYVYYCDNETVHGIEFPEIPDTKGVPLVADMSSNFLSRKFDITKFGVVFAGAQKNVGPAGVTVVIVREDLLGSPLPVCPIILDFTINAKDNSLHNTPPCFAIYVMSRVFEWIKRKGGVSAMESAAQKKSKLLYDFIDSSNGFYTSTVKPAYRSHMNAPFRIGGNGAGDETLEAAFLKGAAANGMIQLKGHRLVGGIRASIYNAVTLEETETLIKYMKTFLEQNKK